jgi:hypothetical protein
LPQRTNEVKSFRLGISFAICHKKFNQNYENKYRYRLMVYIKFKNSIPFRHFSQVLEDLRRTGKIDLFGPKNCVGPYITLAVVFKNWDELLPLV